MDRIRSLVATVRQRLMLEAWLHAALKGGVVAAAVLLFLVVERRLTGGSAKLGLPSGWDGLWIWIALLVVAAGASAAYGAWRARRALLSSSSAALELDARLATGERFTTALELEKDEDPFAKAAVADAVQYAASPKVAEALRERFAVKPPERWWLSPTMLVVALALWVLLPQLNLFGAKEVPEAAVDPTQPRVPSPEEQRLEQIVKAIQESPELAKALDAELTRAKNTLDAGADNRKPEEQAREALRRAAELQERLDQMKNSEQNQAQQALQDALAQLDLPKDQNAARDLAEALKQGDFAAAKKAVDDLKKAASEGKLSQEQRDQLAAALDQTAKQLEQLSKDPQKLADALKNAGMDPSLAQNAQAMQQALQQNKALNQTQKEQIQKMAQSLQQAQQQLGKMSQQMNKMAGQCKNPGGQDGQNPGQSQGQNGQQNNQNGQQQAQQGQQGQQGQNGQQNQQTAQSGQGGEEGMEQMLSQAEASQMMSQAAENAASQCKGGMSESEADSALRSSCRGDGECNKPGSSSGMKDSNKGGRGQASGGNRDTKQTAFGTKVQKQKGARGEGDVIARQLVEGQSPVGESHVALEQVAGKIPAGYEKGTEDDPVPAHLREVHQRYFGDLRRKMEERGVKTPPANGAAPAGSAAPAGAAPASAAPAGNAAPASAAPASGAR